jgi:toxin ParE1/3/4
MEKIVWTQSALSDLRAIHDYVSTDSELYAGLSVEGLFETVERIQQHPNEGRVVEEFNNPEVRELVVGRYSVIFRVSSGVVGIVRVRIL